MRIFISKVYLGSKVSQEVQELLNSYILPYWFKHRKKFNENCNNWYQAEAYSERVINRF